MSAPSFQISPFDGAACPDATVVGAAAGKHRPPAHPVAVLPSAASAVPAPHGVVCRAETAHGGRFLPVLGRSPTAPAPFGFGDVHRRSFLSALIGAVGRSLSGGLITIRKPQVCGRSTDIAVGLWPHVPLADHPERRVRTLCVAREYKIARRIDVLTRFVAEAIR